MHNILACDDNKDFLKMLGSILEKYATLYDAMVTTFDNGTDLLDYCYNNKFDIIYLDVDLGKKNGLDIAKILKSLNPNFLIIYISAYEIYYRDMVNAEPFRFISKNPMYFHNLEKQIADTLEEAMNRIDPKDIWTFSFGKRKYSVVLSRGKYFHSIARTVHIVGDIGDAPAYFYGKIDDIEDEIAKIDKNFVRISKSCIVNKKHSQRYGLEQVRIGDKYFPVTQKYRKKLNKESNWAFVVPRKS